MTAVIGDARPRFDPTNEPEPINPMRLTAGLGSGYVPIPPRDGDDPAYSAERPGGERDRSRRTRNFSRNVKPEFVSNQLTPETDADDAPELDSLGQVFSQEAADD